MLRRSKPMKRTPLHSRRQPPVIALPRRKAREEARLYRELRKAVHARENGCCASCGTVTSLADGECHHRKLRSRGGPDTAFCCIWLCPACHRAAHMDVGGQATRAGWLVPSWADEHAWPVWQPGGREGYWQPTPQGWVKAKPSEQQLWHRARVVSQEVTR